MVTQTKPARAVLGLSHTPLLDLNPLAPDVDADLRAVLGKAAAAVRQFAPELIVLFAPDHFNGFFHELMPPFCIGTAATAVGDYGTLAGAVNVAEADALALAGALIAAGFDPAVSRRMQVDHGVAQPLALMFGTLSGAPVLPIFINAAAPPAVPTIGRVQHFGQAVGQHFDNDPRRILFIGSGGLSHDPPIPTLENPDAAVRERITVRYSATPAERAIRQSRVMEAGRAMAEGRSDRRALNPQWDQHFMDLVERQDWAAINAIPEREIVSEGGGSAHEIKNWVAAFAAGSARPADRKLETHVRWYRAIPELIAGFGVLFRESVG